ncbi:hypothetical protein [Micropruina sonneratiae]|uniref:hypothetical protein n=1 Tax=Micropruina sonneratiae TaxID=2986940 RepID=UPI002227138D|nr:hypothetical protein [Micropruina sp. KQZ13P-5]MCW3158628.1 hypothetical protein [Micropruina sp. KQZ13P-5]
MTQQQQPGGVALPAGLEPFPDLGEDVVGTRPRQVWVILVWVSVVVLIGIALLLGSTLFGPRASVGGAVTAVVFLIVAGAMGWLASSMNRPILTIDNDAVHTHAAFGKGTIQLRSITALRFGPAGRSLIVDADGGIELAGKPSKRPWVAIANIHTYRVKPIDLRDYIADRSRAAKARPA